jgi:hypothetical protein
MIRRRSMILHQHMAAIIGLLRGRSRVRVSHRVNVLIMNRLIAAGLVPLTIAPFAAGSLNPTTDAILCATLLIHSHVGFESVPSKDIWIF